MNILFPIETLVRELDYKLVAAHSIAKSNKEVVCYVGAFQTIHRLSKHFKGGLYVGKTILTRLAKKENGKYYKLFKKNAFDVIYLHEEGAVWQGNEENWSKMLNELYDINRFDKDDVVCVWGNFQKEIDSQRTTKDVRIEVTGHPRFDLNRDYSYLYSSEVDKIKKKYDKFILVNGNFSLGNHGLGLDEVLKTNLNSSDNFLKSRADTINQIADNSYRLAKMVVLVVKLAERYPKLNIVYRPHPSEGLDYYGKVFNGISNIFIEQAAPLGPFIIGSECLIHDGCSTSIEAFVADKPVINYKPLSGKYDYYLPNHVGLTVQSEEEVIEQVDAIFLDKPQKSNIAPSKKATDLFYNFTKKDSFTTFISIINDKILSKGSMNFVSPSRVVILKDFIKYKIIVTLFRTKNFILNNNEKLRRLKYIQNKYGGMNRDEIHYKIDKLNTEGNSNVKVQFINPYLIKLYSE